MTKNDAESGQLRLREWEELVGFLTEWSYRGNFLYIRVGKSSLLLDRSGREAEILEKELGKARLNEKVGIIKTDGDPPLLVRKVT